MIKPDRRLNPPLLIHKLRRLRAADTTHNLAARAQRDALRRLVQVRGGER